MEITFEIYQSASRMMTCAPAWQCPHEKECFHMAKPIVDEWESKQHSAALARAEEKEHVDYYAPHFPPNIAWEWARPDWDAA
jgi:hypothetical protein